MSRSRVGQPTGRRRAYAWLVLSAAALVALSVVSAAGAARTPVRASDAGVGTAADMPVGLSNQQVTVVVQLAKEPVTVADSNAGNNGQSENKPDTKKTPNSYEGMLVAHNSSSSRCR